MWGEVKAAVLSRGSTLTPVAFRDPREPESVSRVHAQFLGEPGTWRGGNWAL